MKITMEGDYQTRDGNKVKILTVNRIHPQYQVVVLLLSKNGKIEDTITYTIEGKFSTMSPNAEPLDLIEVPVAPLVFTDFLLEKDVDLELFWKNLGGKHHEFSPPLAKQTRKEYLKYNPSKLLCNCFLWNESMQKSINWDELNWDWKELVANKPANQEVIFGEFFRNKTNLKD